MSLPDLPWISIRLAHTGGGLPQAEAPSDTEEAREFLRSYLRTLPLEAGALAGGAGWDPRPSVEYLLKHLSPGGSP